MTIPFEFLDLADQHNKSILLSVIGVIAILACIVTVCALFDSKLKLSLAVAASSVAIVLGLAIAFGSFYFGPVTVQKDIRETRADFIQELESTYAIELGDRAATQLVMGITPVLDKPVSIILTKSDELYSLDVVLREVRENEYELLAVNGATQLVSLEEALATADRATNLTEVD